MSDPVEMIDLEFPREIKFLVSSVFYAVQLHGVEDIREGEKFTSSILMLSLRSPVESLKEMNQGGPSSLEEIGRKLLESSHDIRLTEERLRERLSDEERLEETAKLAENLMEASSSMFFGVNRVNEMFETMEVKDPDDE